MARRICRCPPDLTCFRVPREGVPIDRWRCEGARRRCVRTVGREDTMQLRRRFAALPAVALAIVLSMALAAPAWAAQPARFQVVNLVSDQPRPTTRNQVRTGPAEVRDSPPGRQLEPKRPKRSHHRRNRMKHGPRVPHTSHKDQGRLVTKLYGLVTRVRRQRPEPEPADQGGTAGDTDHAVA
jgi:hypothetical protein